ncbi:NADPH:quinone oxidoreductase family protein [Actinocorallia populi]|uniref:NADPH:quinone oxidoreductase family protein n=1 Tax=Actinocorallia populi TaxID=2079200 RepID=UPI000D08AFC8|nr:NADPH:quinone oxidoreductase family protein [Actinocorallia populi]
MRAFTVEKLGSLETVEAPEPVPGPGQVLIEVAAAGANYVDGLFLHGRYQIKPPLPFVPGGEIAGTVKALGPGVEGPAVGSRVVALCGVGGFAEQVVVQAGAAVVIPDVLDFPRAATFTQSYCTALYALRNRAGLQEGETVLVLGAGGGVGLAAVQVAKALGAKVLAGASSPEKREAALASGADAVVDTSSEDVKTAARAFSEGGVDVVYDPVGGALADPALRALRDHGRYAVIGFTGGIPSLPLNQVLLRNRSIVGVDWGGWSMTAPGQQAALHREALDLVAEGRIDPIAPAVRPLAEAGQVLDALLNRQVTGKVALVP